MDDLETRADSLLEILLEEGVSIHNWTSKHAMVMLRARRFLDNHPEMWRTNAISAERGRESRKRLIDLPSRLDFLSNVFFWDKCFLSLQEPLKLGIERLHHNGEWMFDEKGD